MNSVGKEKFSLKPNKNKNSNMETEKRNQWYVPATFRFAKIKTQTS